METRRLGYFVEIVKAGAITRAAQKLGMSQAALSQQLAILEAEFKTRLVDRSRTGVVPTGAGAALFREAKLILRQVEQARAAVSSRAVELSGSVSVGFTASMGALFCVPLFDAVKKAHPQVRLRLVEGMTAELTERLLSGDLDLATLLRNETRAGMQSELIAKQDLMVISPARFNMPARLRLADLGSVPLLMPTGQQTLRGLYDAALRQAGASPNIVVEIDSVAMMKASLIAGFGVTLHPASSWRAELRDGLVRASRIVDVPLKLEYWLSSSPGSLSPAAEAVLGILRDLLVRPHSVK